MLTRIRRLPSPALVIASIALVLAVGGGTFAIAAGSDARSDRKIAKKQANKVVTKRAPSLSVNHANTADSATNATNATNASHATTADTATVAGIGNIVTRSNSVTLNSGTSNTVSVDCNAGEKIISGGGVVTSILPSELVPLTRSIKTGTVQNPGNGWQVSANNTTVNNMALVVQAYCLQSP